RRPGKRGDEPVPLREVTLERRCPEGEFREHRAAPGDRFRQPAMLDRVDAVESGPEDRQSTPAGLEGAGVARGVDATRQAADDGETGRRQVPAQPTRDAQAVDGGAPRPDDGGRQDVLGPQLTTDVNG